MRNDECMDEKRATPVSMTTSSRISRQRRATNLILPPSRNYTLVTKT
jgi:hypothetical protein